MSSLSAVINGIHYNNFISYEVTRSVEDIAGSFTMKMDNGWDKNPPVQIGNKIQIFANKTPILTGHIEKLNVSYAENDHTIAFAGRDNVADLVDSTVGSYLEFKAPTTLNRIIASVMKQINMTGVPVINQVGNIASFGAGDLVAGQIDETIFNFLEKYTKKRQVLMTTDGKGGLVLARAGSKTAPTSILHRIDDSGGPQNNVKSANFHWDDTERFHTYRIHSQGNPAGSAHLGTINNKEITARKGTATDPEIRSTRVLDLIAESSTDNATLTKRAEWEAIIRKARSFTYSCVVQGHLMTPNGLPWEPNNLVPVLDEYGYINNLLLLKTIKYNLTVDGGSTCDLDLVDPDSYKPEPIVEKKQKQKGIGHRRKGKKSLSDQARAWTASLTGGASDKTFGVDPKALQ